LEIKTDNEGGGRNDNLIVIPSHVSGMTFLANLLKSFGNYDRYPILIVVNEYKDEVEPLYQAILKKFSHLPVTIGRLKSNSFEFGALLYAYDETHYDNFFLLPHSCEIVDPKVFEIAFEEHRARSAAFFLRQRSQNAAFWESHIGKYRRETLTAVDFKKFQPHNIFEATFFSECHFTHAYYTREPTAHVFYKLTEQTGEVTEKFGKLRLKMATPYLIKWKTHWSAAMIFKSFPKDQRGALIYSLLYYTFWHCCGLVIKAGFYARHGIREGLIGLYRGALWSPRFYRWRKQLQNHPELREGGALIRRSGYDETLIRFFIEGWHHLQDHALDSGSLVLDVGAAEGEYADRLFQRYGCEIHCFEPIPDYYGQLERRFHGNAQVHTHEVLLGDHTGKTTLSRRGFGLLECSVAPRRPPLQRRPVSVKTKDVAEVFAALDRDVDLLKINIGGDEYPLLKRMLEADLLRRCKKIIVHFHDSPSSAGLARRLRGELIAAIEKTHSPTFSYPSVWEGWERRSTVAQNRENLAAIAPLPSQRVLKR
jgi:FkbM family methyltransferase